MRQFEWALYYGLKEDGILQPTSLGIALILKYLNDKYHANICHPVASCEMQRVGLVVEFVEFEAPSAISFSFDQLCPYLTEARLQPAPYRQSFVLYHHRHAVFFAYLREENGEEGILYSDSVTYAADAVMRPKWLAQLSAMTGLTIYSHLDSRQADSFSCIVDAIVMGRDVTRRDNGVDYYIPNLLTQLKSRVVKTGRRLGWREIRLPHELLKTAQCSHFVAYHTHSTTQNHVIHKQETLAMFRTRYRNTLSNQNDYLRQKGIKYAKNMQIQFYINEMEHALRRVLTTEERLAWVQHAKFAMQAVSRDTVLFPEETDYLHEKAVAYLQDLLHSPAHRLESAEVSRLDVQVLRGAQRETADFLSDLENNLQQCRLLDWQSFTLNALGLETVERIVADQRKQQVLQYLVSYDFQTLSNYAQAQYVLLLAMIAQKNQEDADFVLQQKAFFQALLACYQSTLANLLLEDYDCHGVLLFCLQDAYFSQQFIQRYPDLFWELSSIQQSMLNWVVRYRMRESQLVGYPKIARVLLEQYSGRFDQETKVLLKQYCLLPEESFFGFETHVFLKTVIAPRLTEREKQQLGWLLTYEDGKRKAVEKRRALPWCESDNDADDEAESLSDVDESEFTVRRYQRR